MIERLADPLVHLIRNAIDHGLEDTASAHRRRQDRAGHGSSSSAVHAGAQVLITVTDDGGGLNTARIRAKAEEQGLIAPGAELTDHEIYQFLFHPGFSTARRSLRAVRPRRRHGRGQAHHRGLRGIDRPRRPGRARAPP